MINRRKDILESTFNINSMSLPTIQEIKKHIILDNNYEIALYISTMRFRRRYLEHSFFLITRDLIKTIAKEFQDYNIAELSCGAGWFSYWLNKYGLPIKDSVDNFSWNFIKYKSWIKKQDSIEYVQKNKDIDLFILSWPYMDSVAVDIWNAMFSGQMLLYIGEEEGGCTANDEFYKKTESEGKIIKKSSKNINENFISFYGIHDRVKIIKKL